MDRSLVVLQLGKVWKKHCFSQWATEKELQ